MMRTLQIERCTIYVYRDEHGNAVYVGLTCPPLAKRYIVINVAVKYLKIP